MDINCTLEKLKVYGVGRRKLDDELFADDIPPPRYGVYDLDDENLCHEVIETTCQVPGCYFKAESLLEFENHYNASHRYTCSQCKKVLQSPHLLDLHIQEKHDSFFAVLAAKKPSYFCYIEECKEKFLDAEQRLDHCVKIHKLPKNFRFDQNAKYMKKSKMKNEHNKMQMEVDTSIQQTFKFHNSKQKGFSKYTGKKFTEGNTKNSRDINIDDAVSELRSSLPEQ